MLNLESLKNYERGSAEAKAVGREVATPPQVLGEGRTLYIPYMSDCAYGVAACFRSYGQRAEVMNVADESVLVRGRQFTTGKECLPCAITTGEMLKVLESQGGDAAEKVAFFMPAASGPCRLGMYNCLQRLVLRYNDLERCR